MNYPIFVESDGNEVEATNVSLDVIRSEYEHREKSLQNELFANKQRELTLTNTIAELRNQVRFIKYRRAPLFYQILTF